MLNNMLVNMVVAHKDFLIGVASGAVMAHIPLVIHLVVTSSFISGWIKKYPDMAESIATTFKAEVDAVVKEDAPKPQ